MNVTMQDVTPLKAAMKTVENAERAERDMVRELKISAASAARKDLPTSRNAETASAARNGIDDMRRVIDRLTDGRTVVLSQIETAYGERLAKDISHRESLMRQIEETTARIKIIETDQAVKIAETEKHFADQIEAARLAISAHEAQLAVLAKQISE